MFAKLLKLAEEHPRMRERTFVLTDIFPEPYRRHWGKHKQWVRDKQTLWTTLAYLEELAYVRVNQSNHVNVYRILPEYWTFIEERLALR